MGRLKECEDEHCCTLAFGIDMGEEGTALILVASDSAYSSINPPDTLNNTNLVFAMAAKGFLFRLLLFVVIALMRSNRSRVYEIKV
jgi:hypothetical protein